MKAHFIHESKFINALLDCDVINNSHTSENIRNAIQRILSEWDVNSKVIFAVVDISPILS